MIAPAARLATILLSGFLGLAGCATVNGPYTTIIAPGLHPRLTAGEAVAITRRFLDAQTSELAAPELHEPPSVTGVWAVRGDRASDVDACIPSSRANQIVWVTKGSGDYLNLSDRPWSNAFSAASQLEPSRMMCEAPARQGTLVVDDATGEILGVYPETPRYGYPPSPSG